jgi:outer membrane protein TolC
MAVKNERELGKLGNEVRQARVMRKQAVVALAVLGWFGITTGGCEERRSSVQSQGEVSAPAACQSVDSAAIMEKVVVDQAIKATTQASSVPVGPAAGTVSFSSDEVKRFLPDPLEADIKDIARAKRVNLSLQDCIARVLDNSFKIKTEGYGPAISAMDILKAESQFDAVYFANANYSKTDEPTSDALTALGYDSTSVDTRTLSTGLRKYLPTGAMLSGTYNLNRYYSPAFDLARLDPVYTSNFLVELRQPLLRGFGVDVNRAQIEGSKNNQKIAQYKYRVAVRDTLYDVEKAYWQLVQARRDVVIQRTLVEQTEETYKYLKQREDYDVYSVQITRVSALLGTRVAQYIETKNRVKNAEDQLKALMNDPEINLGEDIEIIPTDFPTLGPLVMDRVSEVQAALECRSEIEQAKLQIENARINVMVAKNAALPKLDLVFQYKINGVSDNAGNSFDQMSTSNYQDYVVGLNFEYPIGNRGPRADQKKATLQRDQAISALREVIENVILEVDVAVRNLQTSYYQVPPSKEAVEAAEKNVEAIIARMTRLSPEYLDVQLSAQETLATARRTLLGALVNYNIAIVQLERAKDTLLRYDNVAVKSGE